MLQVAPEDCTGCGLCVQVCPAKSRTEVNKKAVNMAPQAPIREQERKNWDFFLNLPEFDRQALSLHNVKDLQLLQPLFEFPGACAGCGETPYIKLLTQLFGDRAVIANATGCSSIFGGNLPTTPYTVNRDGRGPAWSNSLFEDNAEFGLGMRVSLDKQAEYAHELVRRFSARIGEELAEALLNADQSNEAGIEAQRKRVAELQAKLGSEPEPELRDLKALAGALVAKSVWMVGGDGWAYDIGYGGLDHVFASGRNVNILVLDTEVYSNTGGQMSKSTPRGAVAKFAAAGKHAAKKDLAMMAMTLRHGLRRARRPGRERHAYAEGVSRSRSVSRAVADHRLQPLHRAWLRSGAWPGTTKGRGAIGLLAAVPLQSGAGSRGAQSIPTRFAAGFPAA